MLIVSFCNQNDQQCVALSLFLNQLFLDLSEYRILAHDLCIKGQGEDAVADLPLQLSILLSILLSLLFLSLEKYSIPLRIYFLKF